MTFDNTLLFGNGINIQFGSEENTNKKIILRAIKETKQDNYPKHLIVDEPELILQLLGYLFLELKDILNHKYDRYAFTESEKSSLVDFIQRYETWDSITIADIGFEDYYLIYDLFCNKNKIYNPDKYTIREALKCFFIYAIYNHGDVELINLNYPSKLKEFFNGFQIIFTTNYDRNVETFSKKKVFYLHGSFYIKKDVYNPNSLRNHLSDRLLDDYEIDENFFYLYSNVLTSYNGNSKLFMIKQGMLANNAVEKFSEAYIINSNIKSDVESWESDSNKLVHNLSEAIQIKVKNPELKFDENYPIKEFESIQGILTIVGLSPNNDTHIFEMIDKNEKIKQIVFYYYDEKEIKQIQNIISLHKDILIFRSVRELWKEYR